MINALILSLLLAPSVLAGIVGPEKIPQRNSIFRQKYEEMLLRSDSVTCSELGNKVFTSDAPFNILGIPDCDKTVKLR